MRCSVHAAVAAFAIAALAAPGAARAQKTACGDGYTREISLSGPRFGLTYLSPGIVHALRDTLRASYNEGASRLTSITTQFGWQFEHQFAISDCGPSALTEMVLLVGGMEQGLAIPSGSFLVGVRMPEGIEFGVGPNISPAGMALAFAGGTAVRSGYLEFPLTLALVPSREGARLSFLAGFKVRREARRGYPVRRAPVYPPVCPFPAVVPPAAGATTPMAPGARAPRPAGSAPAARPTAYGAPGTCRRS